MVAAAILNYGYVDFCRHHRCDLNQSNNIPTKFSDDWSNSKEMATVLQKCISDVIDMFQIEVPMFPPIFGHDRSNSKEMAAVFRNPRWRRPPS